MGGGWNYKRLRLLKHKYKNLEHMKEETKKDDVKPSDVSRSETTCQKCGFKATYKFIRCPSCNEVQK
jgi:lipopolysaccharide biosynthesis regulator YciM